MVVLNKLIRPCGFTSKATIPSHALVKPCAASKGEASWMVRCNGCSGGGKYYCIDCLSKFRRAILDHGGEEGTAFRNLHRLEVLGLDLLLQVDWDSIRRAKGEVDYMQLPPGLAFDEDLQTLTFTSECAVCWRQELKQSSQLDAAAAAAVAESVVVKRAVTMRVRHRSTSRALLAPRAQQRDGPKKTETKLRLRATQHTHE